MEFPTQFSDLMDSELKSNKLKILGDKTCLRGQWPFQLIKFLTNGKGSTVAHNSNTQTHAN